MADQALKSRCSCAYIFEILPFRPIFTPVPKSEKQNKPQHSMNNITVIRKYLTNREFRRATIGTSPVRLSFLSVPSRNTPYLNNYYNTILSKN
jgi:hypothetical protein